MKTTKSKLLTNWTPIIGLILLSISTTKSSAQSTAFTYQGWLNTGGAPASGAYDVSFTVYNSTNSPGTIIAGPITNTPTFVSNGLFTVTLDFGPGVFTGADRWLEIGVRTNGSGAFNNLSPRQKITAAPYTIYSGASATAASATTATTATTANSFSGSLAGNVTGTQSATVVANVGGQSAANVASGVSAANAADSANTPNTIVRRNGSGSFAAGTITTASVSGNGSGLTQLNAAFLATGTVADARLSTNVALLNATQTFTANNAFLGSVGIGNTAATTALTVTTVSDVYGIEHTDGTRRLGTFLNADGAWLGTVGPDALLLFVNNSSAGPSVTIDPSSRVGIGRTPTANKLEVAGSASKDSAGSWFANSDARIKQDIQPLSSALETLEKVRLVSFHYTDNYRAAHAGIADQRYLNVVAQEFREVFPDNVKSSGEKLPDGSEILQVDTYPLTIYSAAAIQELNRKVETGSQRSEARVQKLESENAELRQRLEKLERLMNHKHEGVK